MYGIFRRKRALPASRRGVTLGIDRLETRDCPAAPVLKLTAVPLNNGELVQIQGTVQDENPSNVTINLSGVVSDTVRPDVDGRFNYVTTAAGLGTIGAVARDQENLTSDAVFATITSASPTMTLTITRGSGNLVTVSGVLTDEDPGGRTVTLGGVLSGSTVTNGDGSYSLTGNASGYGPITGSANDPWGNGATASGDFAHQAPKIVNFVAVQGTNNVWEFKGQVLDEVPNGITVRFGGLSELLNRSTITQYDGSFTFCTMLMPNEHGTATAQAQDSFGLYSNVAQAIVG